MGVLKCLRVCVHVTGSLFKGSMFVLHARVVVVGKIFGISGKSEKWLLVI